MVPSDAVELRGSGSYLLIGRRLSFGQLSSRGHRMPGVVGDPHRLADLMRRYLQQSGNEGKLRAFWWRVACGRWHEHALAGAGPLIAEVVRYVNARHWFALEVQEERRGAVSLEQERRQADIRPAVIGPCSGDIGSLSLEEKFSIAFRKVPDHLEESVRASFRNLISPAAIGFTVATTVAIAGVSVASGGTAVPVIIAIGYAMVGWVIFNAVGDLIDTFLLVHNATDERDLDRAATKLASAAAELTVGVLIALLTRGAGRLGVGGKSRVRANQTNEFETVPPSRERLEGPRDVETPRTVREAETSNRAAAAEQANERVVGSSTNVVAKEPMLASAAKVAKGKGLTKADFPEVGKKVSQKQLRHVEGRPEYRGGGQMKSASDAQKVLDAYHSGEAKVIRQSKTGNPIVNYTGATGTHKSTVASGSYSQPTNNFMIKGTKSPSVVPVNPNLVPK
ncbi:hypothetical protein [Aestuariispira ectoiniformans]|uniref:hypothetical protein n=1 Tax=Aestuariispira ectoiniformans TaxID=2775080 RepID=UPI00223B2582|nr:hypothetical protein [Aestuariispira ectoiniformans]